MKQEIFSGEYNDLCIQDGAFQDPVFDTSQSIEIARWACNNDIWQGAILYLRNSIPNDYALVRIPREPEYWLETRETYGSILSIRGAMIQCGGGKLWRRLWKETQSGAQVRPLEPPPFKPCRS